MDGNNCIYISVIRSAQYKDSSLGADLILCELDFSRLNLGPKTFLHTLQLNQWIYRAWNLQRNRCKNVKLGSSVDLTSPHIKLKGCNQKMFVSCASYNFIIVVITINLFSLLRANIKSTGMESLLQATHNIEFCRVVFTPWSPIILYTSPVIFYNISWSEQLAPTKSMIGKRGVPWVLIQSIIALALLTIQGTLLCLASIKDGKLLTCQPCDCQQTLISLVAHWMETHRWMYMLRSSCPALTCRPTQSGKLGKCVCVAWQQPRPDYLWGCDSVVGARPR